ncbi:hypothetical protein L9F63_013310, partial [Diploptera punctata]
ERIYACLNSLVDSIKFLFSAYTENMIEVFKQDLISKFIHCAPKFSLIYLIKMSYDLFYHQMMLTMVTKLADIAPDTKECIYACVPQIIPYTTMSASCNITPILLFFQLNSLVDSIKFLFSAFSLPATMLVTEMKF